MNADVYVSDLPQTRDVSDLEFSHAKMWLVFVGLAAMAKALLICQGGQATASVPFVLVEVLFVLVEEHLSGWCYYVLIQISVNLHSGAAS
jgi:hypothetical protein